MVKEKRILSYFLGWLIVGFLIMFVGINKTFASTYYMNYEYLQQYYDNRGSSLTNITTTWNESFQSYVSDDITTIANSYGAGLSFSSPIPLIKNHTYTLSIYFVEIENLALSIKSEVAVGTSLSDAKVNYANSNYYAETLYSKVNNNRVLQFTFKAGQNGGYIFIPWTTTTNTTQSYVFTEINIDDLGSEGISQSDIDNSLNKQTTIIENKFDNLEQSIVDSNKETQEVIKDQFNSCRDSVNLIDKNKFIVGEAIYAYYELEDNVTYTLMIKLKENGIKQSFSIGFKEEYTNASGNYKWVLTNGELLGNINSDGFYWRNNLIENTLQMKYVVIYPNNNTTIDTLFDNYYIQLVKGSSYQNYEEPGIEICNNKLDEAEETRKGIWATIKDLPNAFMNMLKGLFIPDDGYFEGWFNDLKLFFEEKLGFLATPFTIIIDFINRYLSLNPNEDIVINIPDISVPNFEDYIIIEATTLNWSELLKSKDSLNMLWELYLAFIDVFLILNFINLCETKYNRIFGGDTTPYEYYSVEDSYMYDTDTGEATKMGVHKERKTIRKKVN